MNPLELIDLYHTGFTFQQIDRLLFLRWQLSGRQLSHRRPLLSGSDAIGDDILDWPGFHPAVQRAARQFQRDLQ